ncbi:MAG: DMT family transporter [Fimbriimonadales bacterium]|nr:DMT family transporter [Fimbriimonadales bacterium]MDW8051421.1 EamA family transporter [Armatimonadota bacterium]
MAKVLPVREQYGSAGAGAVAILVFLNLLWAGANPAALVMMHNHRPEWVAAFRFIGAASLLWLLLAIPFVRRTLADRFPLYLPHLLLAAAIGFFGTATAYVCYFWGTRLSTATEATLLVSSSPIFYAVLARLLLKERFPPNKTLGIVMGMAGVWVIVNKGILLREFSGATLGNLLVLGGVLVESIDVVVGKVLAMRYSGVAVLTVQASFASVSLTALALLVAGAPNLAWTPTDFWMWFYLTVVCTVFAFSVWFYIMERAPVGAMGVTIFAQTPGAAFIGYFLLKEQLHPTIWVGAGLIVGGILLTLRVPRSK